MMLITIEQHPLRSDAFDKFGAGMAIEAECSVAIRRAGAYRFNMPASEEHGIPCGRYTECPQERPRDRDLHRASPWPRAGRR